MSYVQVTSFDWLSCIHTFTRPLFGFRCGHGDRGSAVLIYWAIPPPIMPIVTMLFSIYHFWWYLSFNDEYWLWIQDISSRSNAMTLIHGGLGHRPLPFEELIPCKSYLSFIELSRHFLYFWNGKALALAISKISCVLQCQVPRTTPCMFSVLSPLI